MARRPDAAEKDGLGYWRLLFAVGLLVAVEVAVRTASAATSFLALREAVAQVAGSALRLFGLRALVAGSDVGLGGALVTVSTECLPITGTLVGVALLLTEPALTYGRRLVWAAGLLLVLASANTARIALVAWMLYAGHPAVHFMHVYVLTLGLPLIALAYWGVAVWSTSRPWARRA